MHNTAKPTVAPIDFSDLRLEGIEVLDTASAAGQADFAASCGRVCNTATACSCTRPKLA